VRRNHGYQGSFPGGRGPRYNVCHLNQSSAEVKNEWSNTATPSIRLHGVDKGVFNVLRKHEYEDCVNTKDKVFILLLLCLALVNFLAL